MSEPETSSVEDESKKMESQLDGADSSTVAAIKDAASAAEQKAEASSEHDVQPAPALAQPPEAVHRAVQESSSEGSKTAAKAPEKGADRKWLSDVSPAELREYRRGRADGLVGLFTLISFLLAFGAFSWWKSYTPLTPPQHINVMFHDVASLNYQAAVYVDGVRVGSVDKIEIKEREKVEVGIKVNTKKITIPVGSRFIILPNGVVGAKYVEIILPKKDGNKKPPLLTEDMIAEGDDPIRPEIVVNELVEKLSTLDFSAVQEKLSRSLDKMGNVADQVGVLSKKMEPVAERASKTADSVSALADDLRAPVNQMHQILDQKHPLLHMVFGRPGHIKDKKVEQTTQTAQGAVKTTTTSTEQSEAVDAETAKKKKKHRFLGL
jgi:ABC-type transporter Mla subunit MlaD